MSEQPTRTYSNGEITVIWQQHKCIHSAVCFKSLPTVFDPRKRPWISMDGASTAQIKETVSKCPSGALSLEENKPTEAEESNRPASMHITPNGPILVNGPVEVKDAKGNKTVYNKMIALCRCGASKNKPFCDGSHHIVEFKD